MRLRPLNDVVIVKPEPIERHEGLIKLPDKNTVEKISPWATVISCGPLCNYKFKHGQRIRYERHRDTGRYEYIDGVKHRIIYEDYVQLVEEE